MRNFSDRKLIENFILAFPYHTERSRNIRAYPFSPSSPITVMVVPSIDSLIYVRSDCCRISDKLDSLIFHTPQMWNFTSQSSFRYHQNCLKFPHIMIFPLALAVNWISSSMNAHHKLRLLSLTLSLSLNPIFYGRLIFLARCHQFSHVFLLFSFAQ